MKDNSYADRCSLLYTTLRATHDAPFLIASMHFCTKVAHLSKVHLNYRVNLLPFCWTERAQQGVSHWPVDISGELILSKFVAKSITTIIC